MTWLHAITLISLVLASILSFADSSESIQLAKREMALGHRAQALSILESSASQTKNRQIQKEIQSRRILFAEQFLNAAAFQSYQEARGHSDADQWDECLKALEQVSLGDQDNVMVLRLRAICELGLKRFAAGEKTIQFGLKLLGDDVQLRLLQVEYALEQKSFPKALTLLASAETLVGEASRESFAVLKAKLLEQSGRGSDAIEVLRVDQDAHLDHIVVLYELGMMYARTSQNDWPARKALSLFLVRCRHLSTVEKRRGKIDRLVEQAQATLAAIDKKLGV